MNGGASSSRPSTRRLLASCGNCGQRGLAVKPASALAELVCPVCGAKGGLGPLDEAHTSTGNRSSKRPRVVFARPHRPAGVAGMISDVGLVTDATIVLLNVAGMSALGALIRLWLMWLLFSFISFWVAATFAAPLATVVAGAALILLPGFLCAGPLAAFGLASRARRCTTGLAVRRGLRRLGYLLETQVAVALLVGLPVALSVALFQVHVVLGIAALALTGLASWACLRFLLLRHVVVMAAPRRRIEGERARVAEVARPGMLVLVVFVPFALVVASTPNPFTMGLLERVVPREIAYAVAAGTLLMGWTAAIILGSALLAAAHAVLVGRPIDCAPADER